MVIHFNDTRPANGSAETLFEVVTDYVNYPDFNSALIHVDVVRKDEQGAEFVADRRTKIGKKVHAFDRYQRNGDLVVERRYEGNESARSTWTIHPTDQGHCTLNIDAMQSMSRLQGTVMKPMLKHLFYGINFTPFIEEAERRAARQAGATPPA
jgi:ribosome-associated toxin RatA of RatAB toxin-antitoxin module